MKRNYIFFLFAFLIGITFFSCSKKEDVNNELTIQLTASNQNLDFSTFEVKLTDLRSSAVYTSKCNEKGQAKFSLPLGQYNIVAENLINDASTHYGSVENYTVSAEQATVTIEIESIFTSLEKTFLLDELYFNCSTNDNNMGNNYYEEYLTIRNVSDRPLYADGLSFAVCGDYNSIEDNNEKSAYLPDTIIVSQVYTIPGDGRKYLVKPGESLVIAHSAIDHTEGGAKPNAANLTGADFEIYVPHEYSMTTDNPTVDNLIVTYSMFQAFQWGYTGYAPMMLLKAPVDIQDYVDNHKINMTVSGSYGNMKQDYVKLPASWVIDGVEAGSIDNVIHKVLPNSIDRGTVLINDDGGIYGGFNGEFVHRKAAAKGYLQDTNNSSEDFIVVPNGRKNYPIK